MAPSERPDGGDAAAPAKPAEPGTPDAAPAPTSPLVLIDTELPSGAYDTPFEFIVRHSGGTEEPHFALKSGRLPKGAGLMPNGTFFGTPYEWGDYRFEVEVKAGSETVTREFTWRVTTTLMIAYLSDDREPGVQELFVANIGAGAPYAPVGIARADDFTWLKDGKTLQFTQDATGARTTFLVDLENGAPGTPRRLWQGKNGCYGDWSPDQTQYALKCGDRMEFIGRDDLAIRNAFRASKPLGAFAWSPDSSKIWVSSENRSAGEFQHAVVPANATGEVKLIPAVFSESSHVERGEWSPDSRQFLLSTSTATGAKREFYLTDTESQLSLLNPQNVNADRSRHRVLRAGWTSDGRFVYAQGESPLFQVFARERDESVSRIGDIAVNDLQSVRLVTDSSFLYTYRSTDTVRVGVKGGGWEQDVVGSVVLSNDRKKNLVLVRDERGDSLRLGTFPGLGSYSLNEPSPDIAIDYLLFSPDATRVSFTQKSAGSYRTYYSDLRTARRIGVPIDDASTSNPFPEFSPDSRFISSVVSKDGPIDLHVVDVSAQVASDPVKVNGAGRVGHWPSWQPLWPLPK